MTDPICLMCNRPLGEHSHDTRHVCNVFIGGNDEIAPVLTKEQEDAIYAAYMGICVLSTMCKRAGLDMGRARSQELLQELSTAFPTVYQRILVAPLRS